MITGALLAQGLPSFRYQESLQRRATNRDNTVWNYPPHPDPPVLVTPADAYVVPRDAHFSYFDEKAGPFTKLEAYAENSPSTNETIPVLFKTATTAGITIQPTGQVIPIGTRLMWMTRNSWSTYQATFPTFETLSLINQDVVTADVTRDVTIIDNATSIANNGFVRVVSGAGAVAKKTLIFVPNVTLRKIVGLDLGDCFIIVPYRTCYIELELVSGFYRPKDKTIPLEKYWTANLPSGTAQQQVAMSADGRVIAITGMTVYWKDLTDTWTVALTVSDGPNRRIAISRDGNTITATNIGIDIPVRTWTRADPSGGVWVEDATTIVSPWVTGQGMVYNYRWFGNVLALSPDGQTLAVSDNGAHGTGVVLIYRRESGAWTFVQNLTGWNVNDYIGFIVRLPDNDTCIIGAVGSMPLYSSTPANRCSEIYFFTRINGVWVKTQLIQETKVMDLVGFSMAVSGDGKMLAYGAIKEHRVYFYQRQGTQWVKMPLTLEAEKGDSEIGFSVSLSEDGSRLAIGKLIPARMLTDSYTSYEPKICVQIYELDGLTWKPISSLLAYQYNSYPGEVHDFFYLRQRYESIISGDGKTVVSYWYDQPQVIYQL